MKQFVGIVLLMGMFVSVALAQTGNVRGNIYDKESGEPISFATVQLSGTTMGATYDLDGFFNIANVPVGGYSLVATYIGYDSIAVDVNVKTMSQSLCLWTSSS